MYHFIGKEKKYCTLVIILTVYFSIPVMAQKKKQYGPEKSFFETPEPPKPDYSNPNHWAALPSKQDPSDFIPKGIPTVNFEHLKADVFFVHPTIYLYKPKTEYGWNGDVNDEYLNKKVDKSTIKYQASIFNAAGKVYAPRYRQAHIHAFRTQDIKQGDAALNLAYQDVKEAFEYYLKNFNQGRPFIIAGHSQGTIHAAHLIRDLVDGKELSKKLVAAYLVGIPIPRDSFKVLKPCATPWENSCLISWSTYAEGYAPPYFSYENCVAINPLTWTLDTLPAPYECNRGAVLRNFNKIHPEISNGRLHNGMLWIGRPNIFGASLLQMENYHIGDYNIFYINVRENAVLRVQNYLNTH
mgnify:CR=1 FL=1